MYWPDVLTKHLPFVGTGLLSTGYVEAVQTQFQSLLLRALSQVWWAEPVSIPMYFL